MNGFRRHRLFDLRVLLLLVPALAVLAIDLPVLMTLGYSLAAMFVVLALAHIGRRVLFPYVDLELFALQAMGSATGAGLVFLGISIVIAVVALSTAIWIAK